MPTNGWCHRMVGWQAPGSSQKPGLQLWLHGWVPLQHSWGTVNCCWVDNCLREGAVWGYTACVTHNTHERWWMQWVTSMQEIKLMREAIETNSIGMRLNSTAGGQQPFEQQHNRSQEITCSIWSSRIHGFVAVAWTQAWTPLCLNEYLS